MPQQKKSLVISKIIKKIIQTPFAPKAKWLVLSLLAVFSIWLMFFTFGYRDGEFVMRSRLWSDFAAHLPMIRSFSLGRNYPIEYPQFANEPIRYHFLFYLLVGWLERIGINIAFGLNFLSALGFFGLLAMIYFIAGKLATGVSVPAKHKNTVALTAGILAVFLFLFNSSLTFVDYFQQQGLSISSIVNIPRNNQFINFGPWNGDDISAFWHWNVYTNQRHLAFSLALGLMAIWPLINASLNKKNNRQDLLFGEEIIERKKNSLLWKKFALFGIWFSLILLPFFNLAAYVMTVIFIGAWLVLNPGLIKSYGLFYGLNILFSLPSFYYYWRLGGSGIAFEPGFLAQDKTWLGIIYYWWRNLGLYIVLWPVLFLVGNLQQKKWWLIFSFYFVLANLFRLSTDMINNHKLINFFQLGFTCLLGAKMGGYWVKSILVKIVTILLLVPLTLSGFIDGAAIANDHQGTISDPAHEALGKWLLANTAPDSVFVTTHYLYNPASLVGRKTYLDYGYFAWSMGYETSQRRTNLNYIFGTVAIQQQWCELMMSENIDYVLISQGKGDLDIDVRQSWLVQNFEPEYISPGGYEVYDVGMICDTNII